MLTKKNLSYVLALGAVAAGAIAPAAFADAGAVDYSAITSAVQTGMTNVATGAIAMLSAVVPVAIGALGAMAIWKWGRKLIGSI
ncbi:hypothetical protein [Silvimonas sp.]|uniref:hypothetical protein n=1 Tax=Silvimonas sp. TaxID=2650811 RepID=UPI00284A8769|nr:hypothetical protein [Silvimonas sp.]MDR3426915.1 hypothetical protein [Silvimonas sp.]